MRRAKWPVRIAVAANLFTAVFTVSADVPAADASQQETVDRMIAGCFDYAAEKKLSPLSVAIVDEGGALIGFMRQNGASAVTAEVALLKARTAVRTRMATHELTLALARDAALRDTFILLQLTALPGGVPLWRSDASLRGAVGVSGAKPEQDAECAQRAMATASGIVGLSNNPRGVLAR